MVLALAWVAGVASQRAAVAETIDEKAAVCSGCHGEKGVPTEKNIPVIWGQQEGYLYLQLRDFKRGARQNEIMSPLASGLEKDDMKALAAYFAAKTWPNLGQPAASAADTATAKTANGSIGCSACHLEQFQGTGTTPRLAGQNHDYILKTLTDFRSGARANNPGMTSLAKSASEADLAALANYLAGL